MRGGIYPDDLLLFPLQLDELPSTRAELLYHVCTTTKQPPRGCCWCSVLPSTESLVSSDLSWKITPNDQDAGGACLLLLSYRLYVLLQICCTKHLKLSGVPGFQLWTIHIHISLHVEWIVSTSCNLVLVGKGKWNNANDGRKIERLTYPTILHYTDSLIQIIIFASTLLVLTFLNSTWGSFTNHGPAMVVGSLQKGPNDVLSKKYDIWYQIAWSSNLLLHFSYS